MNLLEHRDLSNLFAHVCCQSFLDQRWMTSIHKSWFANRLSALRGKVLSAAQAVSAARRKHGLFGDVEVVVDRNLIHPMVNLRFLNL